jgi:hypothetical protein
MNTVQCTRLSRPLHAGVHDGNAGDTCTHVTFAMSTSGYFLAKATHTPSPNRDHMASTKGRLSGFNILYIRRSAALWASAETPTNWSGPRASVAVEEDDKPPGAAGGTLPPGRPGPADDPPPVPRTATGPPPYRQAVELTRTGTHVHMVRT